ncbi:hypothetical protein FDP41_009704 [Naegleria fowleri]|uniref:Uncharacterized protein n=1 Tax=Naegleria fowleri TaxID=5763 RepID=A0A6A5BDK4_NAEFO|nr:uncharacterized protein FDP41_009704 [Naegleria fowleri]KAF0972008.1 hypothetical protein FDP41_009704 [Naegleria fowleri]CAG4708682.1 unnamed protein product [Naegleria fowleri]
MSEPTNEPFEQEQQTNNISSSDDIVHNTDEDSQHHQHVDSAEVNMTTAPIEDTNKTESNVADDDDNATHQAKLESSSDVDVVEKMDEKEGGVQSSSIESINSEHPHHQENSATPSSTENTTNSLESSSSNEEQPQHHSVTNTTITENEQPQHEPLTLITTVIHEQVTTTTPSAQIAEPQATGEKNIQDEGHIDELLESVLGDTFGKIIASTSEKKESEEEEEIEELQTAGSLANKQPGGAAAIHLDDDEDEEGEPNEADLINILKQLSGNAHEDEDEHHAHPLNGQTTTIDEDDEFEDMNEEEEAAIKMGENLTSMFGKARATSDHHHSGSSEPGVGWTVAEYALTAAAVFGIGYFLNKVVD